jgi:hypothetical protein
VAERLNHLARKASPTPRGDNVRLRERAYACARQDVVSRSLQSICKVVVCQPRVDMKGLNGQKPFGGGAWLAAPPVRRSPRPHPAATTTPTTRRAVPTTTTAACRSRSDITFGVTRPARTMHGAVTPNRPLVGAGRAGAAGIAIQHTHSDHIDIHPLPASWQTELRTTGLSPIYVVDDAGHSCRGLRRRAGRAEAAAAPFAAVERVADLVEVGEGRVSDRERRHRMWEAASQILQRLDELPRAHAGREAFRTGVSCGLEVVGGQARDLPERVVLGLHEMLAFVSSRAFWRGRGFLGSPDSSVGGRFGVEVSAPLPV